MDYRHEPHGLFFMIDNKSFYASVESVARQLNPLRSVIVVMSEADNTGSGLVLAASPMAKKLFGISNVSRQYEVPDDPRILVVPPRMNLYIQENLKINKIFREYVADNDLVPYSIDESILDMTKSWRLFGKTPEEVARRIQLRIRHEMGLYTTVGIGENPVQAKLALDLQAKHDHELIGRLTYESFPEAIWPITDLTSVWSIGRRTAAHLNRLGIHSMRELAMVNPYELQAEMGLIGAQLFALAWGIDRSQLHQLRPAKEKSWSNSQVLPRDYRSQQEIEVVIREIGLQVTARMRHHHQQAGCVSLGIGFARTGEAEDGRSGFHHSCRIEPTDNAQLIAATLLRLFRQHWEGQAIRNISVGVSRLNRSQGLQLDIFQDPQRQLKNERFDRVIDELRDRFGKTAVIPASSLLPGGTMLSRAALVGGHNGGNSFD
ncbi:Y-family DNA polymerase [Lactobacillus sp. ZJLC29-4]|uniref:Y-family DNA polymerase n=2 Tax=Levilactobacillus tujiorum TaxID=2912243 RepID=A0ABX1L5M3_9LACO|nr:Y-family DNA polymerase [Lactobacillus sp. HBUAS51387]NLR29182.1 Y-family DNA polymerase [Levilactobacillus tujiorum]